MPIIKCSNCSREVAFVPGAFEQISCPFCFVLMHVEAAPEEVHHSQSGVKVGDCLSFLGDLPDRVLMMRLPNSNAVHSTVGVFRNAIRTLSALDIVYTADFTAILLTMRKHKGYACFEYGCAFEHLQDLILQSEALVRDCPKSREIVQVLRKVEAMTEVGTDCKTYERKLQAVWLPVKDYCESTRFKQFSSLINGTFQNYQIALNNWRKGPSVLPLSFWGGGFGLRGAIEGIAAATALNAVVGFINAPLAQSFEDSLRIQWGFASRKIAVARRVCGT